MQIPKKVPQQRYMTSRLEMCAWFHFPTRVSFISSLLCHAPRIQKCHIATLKLEKLNSSHLVTLGRFHTR